MSPRGGMSLSKSKSMGDGKKEEEQMMQRSVKKCRIKGFNLNKRRPCSVNTTPGVEEHGLQITSKMQRTTILSWLTNEEDDDDDEEEEEYTRGRGCCFPLPVYDTGRHRRFRIRVSCSDTVRELKYKIYQKTGYYQEFQRLYHHHHHRRNTRTSSSLVFHLGDDDATTPLLSFHTHRRSKGIIVVSPKPQQPQFPSPDQWLLARFLSALQDLTRDRRGREIIVFVEEANTCGRCYGFNIDPMDTIDSLKTMASSKMRTDFCTALVFGRTVLTDGSRTLAQYGIKDRDVIRLCDRRCFYISVTVPSTIRDAESGEFKIKAVPFDTIRGLKEKIQKKTGLPPEKQLLKYYTLFMDIDEWLLMDYGILSNNNNYSDRVVMLIPSP